MTGDLAGFLPIYKVWPDVKTDLPDGTRVTMTTLIAGGKPIQVSVCKSSVDQKAVKAFSAALKKWRFAMPLDGTSPVTFTVTWEARHGKFVVGVVEVGVTEMSVRYSPDGSCRPVNSKSVALLEAVIPSSPDATPASYKNDSV